MCIIFTLLPILRFEFDKKFQWNVSKFALFWIYKTPKFWIFILFGFPKGLSARRIFSSPQVGHFYFRFISTRLTSCKLAKFAKWIISFNASQESECTPDGKFPLSLFIAILKLRDFTFLISCYFNEFPVLYRHRPGHSLRKN